MEAPAIDAKRTVNATLFDWSGLDHPDYYEPGASQHLYPGHLAFACPGCGRVGAILAGEQKPVPSPSWKIESGILDDPTTLTLSPSINCVGCCGWHGYLRNGVYVSC